VKCVQVVYSIGQTPSYKHVGLVMTMTPHLEQLNLGLCGLNETANAVLVWWERCGCALLIGPVRGVAKAQK
jgi:hypothetical protein